MTHNEMIAVIAAHRDGKKVQFAYYNEQNWCGLSASTPPSNFNDFSYRIAPEPKLRPWTAEEVPVGAQIRISQAFRPNSKYRAIIIAVNGDEIMAHNGDKCLKESFVYYLETYDHSTDGGKTWMPCGVEETV